MAVRDMVKTEELVLEQVRYVLAEHVDTNFLRDNTDLVRMASHIGHSMGLMLEVRLYAHPDRVEWSEECVVPDDWWSHFKTWAQAARLWWLVWFLWMMRRGWVKRPVMKRCVFTAKGRLVFPDIPAPFRDRHRVVAWVDTDLSAFALVAPDAKGPRK